MVKEKKILLISAISFVSLCIFVSMYTFIAPQNIKNISWISAEKLPDITGEKRKVSDFIGEKLTIINFWATWCAPCVEEMPMLSKFYELKKIEGISVIGLAIDNENRVNEFLRNSPVNHHIFVTGAEGTEIMEKIGLNQSNALPFTIMIDKTYNVVKIKLGKLTSDELLYWVNSAER